MMTADRVETVLFVQHYHVTCEQHGTSGIRTFFSIDGWLVYCRDCGVEQEDTFKLNPDGTVTRNA